VTAAAAAGAPAFDPTTNSIGDEPMKPCAYHRAVATFVARSSSTAHRLQRSTGCIRRASRCWNGLPSAGTCIRFAGADHPLENGPTGDP